MLADGYGGDSWPQVSTVWQGGSIELVRISKDEYADGQAAPKSRFPTSRRWACEGIDALVVFPDARTGDAAITSVYKSGKVIVGTVSKLVGKAGVNHTNPLG